MKTHTPRAARAFLLVALPLCALSATAQNLRSSVTAFDKQGNPIIQEIERDPNRSSITSFDREGNAVITYTSPPVAPNDKLTGQTPPNPNPGLYRRFGYSNTTPYPAGYYNYPPPAYGYPAPIYPPAYPVQNQAYVSPFGFSNQYGGAGNSITVIPLTPSYSYPVPYPYPYPYPVPAYGYPAPTYGYPAPAGYPYGNGTYSSNTTGYGITFGRGGFSASIGGSNTTSRTSTTITIR